MHASDAYEEFTSATLNQILKYACLFSGLVQSDCPEEGGTQQNKTKQKLG